MKKTQARTSVMSAILLGTLSFGLLSAPAANATTPAVVSVQAATAPSPSTDPYNAQVLSLINQKRAAVGSAPVKWNQTIGNISQEWSEHLGEATKSSTFDWNKIHRSDAGGSLLPSGATWYREIVGFNGSAQSIVDWWMGSASHKAAMLDPKATDIGIGYVVPTSGPYTGWHMVVSNLAAYPNSTPAVPVAPTSLVLKTIDPNGKLWSYNAPGNNSLGGRNEVGAGWGNAKQILSVDWNSDGILDIVARWSSGWVTMYAGIGGDDYRAPVNIGLGGWEDYDITATKLRTTDRYPGLVARNAVTGNLYYYNNTSGGAIGSRTEIGTGGWQVMSEINAMDWDKDGKMDLIVRNPTGKLVLYRTNGAGTILNEARPVVDFGWEIFESINLVPDFTSKGSVGFMGKTPAGELRYYPIANGKFNSPTIVGLFGWNGYNVANGTVR